MSDFGRRHRFCDRSSALTYEVTLNVPGAAEAQRLLLWSGDPLASQALAIGPKGLTARLEPGVFLAETAVEFGMDLLSRGRPRLNSMRLALPSSFPGNHLPCGSI